LPASATEARVLCREQPLFVMQGRHCRVGVFCVLCSLVPRFSSSYCTRAWIRGHVSCANIPGNVCVCSFLLRTYVHKYVVYDRDDMKQSCVPRLGLQAISCGQLSLWMWCKFSLNVFVVLCNSFPQAGLQVSVPVLRVSSHSDVCSLAGKAASCYVQNLQGWPYPAFHWSVVTWQTNW